MTCPIIYEFKKGTPAFLYSNFFPVEITVTLLIPTESGAMESVTETYDSVEHAFQAAKTYSAEERQAFRRPGLKAWEAKQMGRVVTLRKNWESSKVAMMARLLEIKFEKPELRQQLLATAPKMLMEGNYWHDNFWGTCFCPRSSKGCQGSMGANNLGKLLMNLRTSIQTHGDLS
jgi:ribA/ribD-fused uncharacterized protein